MFSTFPFLAAVQCGLILLSIRWYLRRNDEAPLLVSLFLAYVGSFRFWSVTHGWSEWANITNFGFAAIENDAALAALQFIVLGQVLMTLAYLAFQRRRIAIQRLEVPAAFAQWLRPKVFGFALISIPLVYLSREFVSRQAESGKSLGFEVSSSLTLLPMMLIGAACLLLLLWRFGAFP